MNPGDTICTRKRVHTQCKVTEDVRDNDVLELKELSNQACSFIVPQHLSMYIEEFHLGAERSPDNFVLHNGRPISFQVHSLIPKSQTPR